jgi:hypothetical protein
MDIRNQPGGRDNDGGWSDEPATSDQDASTRTAFSRLAPRDLNAGDAWGGLRIVDRLGRGGFGCVYRAWDDTLAREVALKIMRIPGSAPELAAELLAEGRLLARVRHRNVVTVYGAQQISDEVGLWMELVRGRSLADIIRQDGPLGADEAIVIGSSLAHALAAVHAAGLLHRDVKANNVMREAGGRIVLMDFGAGRDVTAAAARAGRGDLTGTPVYMAPEVLTGQQATPSTDLYSLGVLLFFLVTGRFPVEGRSVRDVLLAHGQGKLLLSDLRPDLPDGFVRIVERALAADPKARYHSAGSMLRDFMEATGEERYGEQSFAGVPAGPVPLPPYTPTPRLPSDAWRPASGTTAPAAGLVPIVLRWIAALSGVLGVVWTLGFLMSVAFDHALGRAPQFSSDTPLTWLTVGIQSLVAPIVWALLVMLGVRLALSSVQGLSRLFPPIRDAIRRAAPLGRALRLQGLTPSARGQVVLALQVGAVALVWIAFRDLIAAFIVSIDSADAAVLRRLAPGNVPILYRFTLTVLLLGMVSACYYTWLRQPPDARPDRVTRDGGVAVIMLVLLMLEVPYRVMYGSYFQPATWNGMRCFVLGETAAERLIHCPSSTPPRNAIVGPEVRPVGGPENLFVHYK